MSFEQQEITMPTRANPYTVPQEQQGWRGIGLTDISAKRRSYTLFWNEQVLVCALLLIPGERSIRHSHETGELSITFSDSLHPSVGYTPAGMLHGGTTEALAATESSGLLTEALMAGMPQLKELLEKMLEEQRQLRATIEQLRAPAGPRMLIDITFPPFKTTIDDPAYPETRLVVGPWYD